jgi:flagellar hook assembly protein FlgD
LRIYDAAGRLVRTIRDGSYTAGAYSAIWDARDGRGALVGAGVYFLELRVDGQRLRRRAVLIP